MADAPESVSELTARIKGGLEQWFRAVWVEGELSNVKLMSSSPHAYFTLKDSGAQLSCAFFGASRNQTAARILRDGAKIRVLGDISVYPPRGSYQLIVRTAEPVGTGELMLQFEALKLKLAQEGLFDQSRKRPLPALPSRVGIVTSPTGAAIRDFLNVTKRRFAGLHVMLAPARVQGDGAAAEIAQGVRMLCSLPEDIRPEVIVVGRGGGSIEDLWCFNDEALARTVRASPIPVISAVGHEIDFTICDFAADLRAPTPSAAAELVVSNRADLVEKVSALESRLSRGAASQLQRARTRVEICIRSRAFSEPASRLREEAQRIDTLSQRMESALTACVSSRRASISTAPARMAAALSASVRHSRARISALALRPAIAARNSVATAKARIVGLRSQLAALSPLAVLDRGYALVTGADGKTIARAADVSAGEKLLTRFSDGTIQSVALEGTASGKATTRRASGNHDERQPSLFD